MNVTSEIAKTTWCIQEDGLWKVDFSCGQIVSGVQEEHHIFAERVHFQTCEHCSRLFEPCYFGGDKGDPMSEVKLSVLLSEDAVHSIEQMAEDRGSTMSDVIRRALLDAKFFHDEIGFQALDTRAHNKYLLTQQHPRHVLISIRDRFIPACKSEG